jgi:hypothetical protein
MPIPIQLVKSNSSYKLERPILPGQSDLMISFFIKDSSKEIELSDKKLFEPSKDSIFLINPPQIKFELLDGGLISQIDESPEGMKGYKITYPESNLIKFSLKGIGSKRATPQERKIVNGNIFQSALESTYGVLIVLSLLFFLSFLLIYNKKNISKI